MSKSENEKWIATIPTQSSANSGKIDLVSDLLVPYSELSAYFLKDIDFLFAIMNYRNIQKLKVIEPKTNLTRF